jgi:hypothetical protein
MLLVPRLPDSVGPLVGAVVVVDLIAHVEEVTDGQLSGTRVTTENREVVAPVNYTPQYVGGAFRRKPQLEQRIEPGKVNEYRLAITSVAAVAGMLSHVGVDDQSVRWRIAEALQLVGLELAEHLPAARGGGNVLVDRPVNIWYERQTLRASCCGRRVGHGRQSTVIKPRPS